MVESGWRPERRRLDHKTSRVSPNACPRNRRWPIPVRLPAPRRSRSWPAADWRVALVLLVPGSMRRWVLSAWAWPSRSRCGKGVRGV